MAGADGIPKARLDAVRRLTEEPRRFSLFAALRLVERADPARPRIGESRRPADEWVRVEQPPYLAFAATDVVSADARAGGRLYVEQLGFGVFGPNGALPLHLSEVAFERRRHHEDATVSDFVNLFQHRLAALFYRAWADSDPVASCARPQDDAFAVYIGALIGLLDESALGRDSVADAAKLCRAGLLSAGAKSAVGLQGVLADHFGQQVVIREFVGGWLRIPKDQRTRLGGTGDSATLGGTATLGEASWQRCGAFEVVVGPLPFDVFLQFLPGSRALRALGDLVRLYTSGEWRWRVRLLLDQGEAPGTSLGKAGRLGWTSWLGQRDGVASDVVQGEGVAEAA